MDVFKTPGAFSWNELMTTDPAAAQAFYGALFGWSFREQLMPDGKYLVGSIGETALCGVMKLSPQMGAMPPAWGAYVTVADVEASLAKAKELGGRVLVEPFEVPQVGRIAVIQDPQGAVISVIQYAG